MKKILGIVAGIVGIISVIVGVALKMNNNAIAIIGGADGPTSVFVAGKLNSVLVSILLIAIGVVMLIVAIIFYFLKKKCVMTYIPCIIWLYINSNFIIKICHFVFSHLS